MSDPTVVASSPAPDNLDWFRALTSPASEAPVADQPPPEPAAAPTPEVPVAAEPETPTPEPQVQPEPNPEIEALRRQVAENNERLAEWEREKQERLRADADAQRQADLDSYWEQVEANLDKIDDEAERKSYLRSVKDDLLKQESQHHERSRAERELVSAVQNFPDHIGQQWNLTADQIAKLRTYADNPNPVVAGQLMAGAAMAYRDLNQSPNNPAIREQAVQAVADRAAAEAKAEGVTEMGGITGANPAPTAAPPTAIRPGSTESFNMLAGALSALNQR